MRNLPTNTKLFCAVYDYVENVDLSKGYQNPKRVTTHFSEIIDLKFGKKLPNMLCILKLFFELCLYVVTHIFLFRFQLTLLSPAFPLSS